MVKGVLFKTEWEDFFNKAIVQQISQETPKNSQESEP